MKNTFPIILLCVFFYACTSKVTNTALQIDPINEDYVYADSIGSFRVYSDVYRYGYLHWYGNDSIYNAKFRYYEYPETCIDTVVLKKIQAKLDSLLALSPPVNMDSIPSFPSPIYDWEELGEFNGWQQLWEYRYLTTTYNAHGVYSCCLDYGVDTSDNGGHPLYASCYHTFDLKSGNEFCLEHILSSAQILRLAELILQFADEGEDWRRFSNFVKYTLSFDKYGIVLHYCTYEISCWARGPRHLRLICDPIKILSKDKSYIDSILADSNNVVEIN